MIKAVITDLDRTLLRTDKTVSEYTYAVLKKCQSRGILFMAATARVKWSQGIFSNVPIPEWNAAVFNGFPSLPTESIIYKLLFSHEENNIQHEVEGALTSDVYMTVAEG